MSVIRFTDDLSLEERFELGRLHEASATGDLDEIKRLLQTDHRKLINVFDELSLTPLMRAAMNGHIEAVKLLLAVSGDFVDGGVPNQSVVVGIHIRTGGQQQFHGFNMAAHCRAHERSQA